MNLLGVKLMKEGAPNLNLNWNCIFEIIILHGSASRKGKEFKTKGSVIEEERPTEHSS